MECGKKLYELRKQKHLSQEAVANELNVSRQSISLWETNQASPSMENLIAFAKLFQVSLDELIGIDSVVSETKSKTEKPNFTITYLEDKHIIFRRDYQYLNNTKEGLLFFITLFLYLFALGMFISATNVVWDVARILLVIGFVSSIIGIPIYPMYIYTNIKKKLNHKNKLKIEFYQLYVKTSLIKKEKEELIEYKMIDYYVEKKDYYLLFVFKGKTVYIPKQGTDQLDDFLSDRIDKKNRKNPFWKC